MINIPKGTKDVLPEQSCKWQYVENTAREVARVFGYKEVRTPVFEYTAEVSAKPPMWSIRRCILSRIRADARLR